MTRTSSSAAPSGKTVSDLTTQRMNRCSPRATLARYCGRTSDIPRHVTTTNRGRRRTILDLLDVVSGGSPWLKSILLPDTMPRPGWLLRALQEKQVERLGGGHTIHVDVRVIAATNQDLASMVEERKFRADFYYRLNVFPIALPPLRERRDDILLLAEYFIRKFAQQQGKVINAIPDEVMAALEHHDWPGNIRELQNAIERGVIMTTGPVLSRQTTERLKPSATTQVRIPVMAEPVRMKTLADAERAHITATLRETNWMIGGLRGAAAQLGLPRTTLIAKMQRLGISNGTSHSLSGQSTRQFVRVMRDGFSPHLRDDSAADLRVLEAVG